MRVFLTGGTGLIGRVLSRSLTARGDTPVIVSRSADKVRLKPAFQGAEIVQGDPSVPGSWEAAVDGCEAVINLVGHNLFAERWSPEVKAKIRDSRVVGTDNLVAAIARAKDKPKTLVQASAIGFYGPTGDEDLTEESPAGKDFMAEICQEWEAASKPAEALGLRVPVIRTGVVLAKGDAALGVMAPIFKWLPGGAAPVGSGKNALLPAKGQQWMSWIHLADIAGVFLFALDNPGASGPINGTSPNPVRNYDFSKELAKAVGRKWVFSPFGPPDAMLNLVLGEVAQVVTKGQKVLPRRALALGYRFEHPDLAEALANIFGADSRSSAKTKPEAAGVAS